MRAVFLFCALAAGAVSAQDALRAFEFNDAAESAVWKSRVHAGFTKDVKVADGVLSGIVFGTDPFVTLPFDAPLETSVHQVVEFRAKTTAGGRGEIFWQPVDAPLPLQKWSVDFAWDGDGEWNTYRVRPFWHGERVIKSMRLDFAVTHGTEEPFELDWVRVVNAPLEGSLLKGTVNADENKFMAIEMRGGVADGNTGNDGNTGRGASQNSQYSQNSHPQGSATLIWATDAVSGLHKKRLRLITDGEFHAYNVDLSAEKEWKGNVVYLRVEVEGYYDPSSSVRSVKVSDDLIGGPDIYVIQARMADAINRVGKPAKFVLQMTNIGGEDGRGGLLQLMSAPPGVRLAPKTKTPDVKNIPAGETVLYTFDLIADRAASGEIKFSVALGNRGTAIPAEVEFTDDLKLPKAVSVPEPKPVKSEYEIGALYFPGWPKVEAWERIWKVAPERKPVLGWYDEANPEVVDWQIKWAVENGISYFMVDWYWDRGRQHLDHWVKAFQKARHKSFLKWAVMWANHNPPGSHSEADQRAVTEFWCKNYFNTPEYYRIDGRPVVLIWSPKGFDDDMGEGGCKRALEISQEVAKAHGLKGIYFIAMKWPEASYDPNIIRKLKDDGFEMTSIYHYMDHAGKAQDPSRFPFELVRDSNKDLWEGLHATGILPFLPNLSTGWDDRPWHGDRGTEIYGRTVADFKQICADAKDFADRTGVKNFLLAPLNEWGEGSYIEPCTEFGFGMYEAVRDTFCVKPAGGWPLNYAPSDVGLGPYDLPYTSPKGGVTAWNFKGEGKQGWTAHMGAKDEEMTAEGWRFVTTTRDPAVAITVPAFRAKNFSAVRVRMKASQRGGDVCQLFWSPGGTPTERTSLTLPLATDGEWHDYVFKVADSPAWKGLVRYLRFDPCATAGVTVTIASVALE